MSATVDRRASAPPTMELVAWYFLRLSGIAMLVLVLGHVFIMHYLNAPSETIASFVQQRWVSLFWLGFDWLLLVAALLHGLVGFQSVARDYLHGPTARRAVAAVVALLAVGFVGIGTFAIFSFDPSRGAATGDPTRLAWAGDTLAALLTLLATATYVGAVMLAGFIALRLARGIPLGLWSFPGQWAWALHRLTGLGIVGFLLIHVLDILLLPLAPAVYDRTIAAYGTPYLIPMEVALVGAVLFHALNGARLIAVELWLGAPRRTQRRLIYAMTAAAVILVLPSIVVILRAPHG